MCCRLVLLAGAALLPFAPSGAAQQAAAGMARQANPDECPPYGQHRFVDPTGRYYVVVKEEPDRDWWDQRASFSFVQAAEGRRLGRTWRAEGHTVVFRDLPTHQTGDAVIAEGHLPPGVGLPGTMLVSSTGWGFVALAGWCDWHTHSNDIALTVVKAVGEVTLQLKLADLFTERELAQLPFVRGPRSWLRGAWLDEEAGVIVLAGDTDLAHSFRFVDRETGKLLDVQEDILTAALDHPDPTARATAVTILGENRGFVGKDRARLLEFLDDPEATVRLSAATVLDSEGDERGFIHLNSVALDPTARMADRRRAVEALLRGHLDEAIPIVRPLLPSAETADETVMASEIRVGGWSTFVMLTLEEIGDEAIPRIVDIVLDDTLLARYRLRGVEALANLGTEPALSMLTTLISYENESISSHAMKLLVARLEDRSIPGRLCGVLEAGGSPSEAQIARFFKNREYSGSVGPLELALRRLNEKEPAQPKDQRTRTLILEALAFQRGEDAGG